MKNNKTLQLFLTFLKIGAFTFGGGYAMIPLIQREIVDRKAWLAKDDLLDIVAIAETTPGPIAINTATFVGYRVAGIWGAIVSTLGVVLPSFWIIVLIAMLFRNFKDAEVVRYAFWGIRIGVLALIVNAMISMYKQCPKQIVSYAVALFALIAVAIFNLNVLYIIVVAALIGIIYQNVKKGRASR